MDVSIKILIVDDTYSMRRIVANTLRSLGFKNCVDVESAEAALSLLKRESFDLIMSDWNMPGMSGLEFLQKVRSSPEHKHIPFMMVTAEGNKENVISAVKAGVSQYIVKPFSKEQLEKKIGLIFK